MVRTEVKKVGFLRKEKLVRQRIGTIGYCDVGNFVAMKDIKAVRRFCSLTEDDGVDSNPFYDDDAVLDAFVNQYRTVLRRLGKR